MAISVRGIVLVQGVRSFHVKGIVLPQSTTVGMGVSGAVILYEDPATADIAAKGLSVLYEDPAAADVGVRSIGIVFDPAPYNASGAMYDLPPEGNGALRATGWRDEG